MQLIRPLLALTLWLGFASLEGQSSDTSSTALPAAPDSLLDDEPAWTTHLVPHRRDAPKPYRLHLPWDEWGHSDLTATTANPFVASGVRIGAARLDGSLGSPVLSAVIPSAVVERSSWQDSQMSAANSSFLAESIAEAVTFDVAPMQDLSRSDQTFFFWDQGDYRYRDVQVGSVVQLDEYRNLLVAGQGQNHPGQFGLAGPARGDFEGNVLQNYLLDYRRSFSQPWSLNYTFLHQRERVGLPLRDSLTADRRRAQVWAQGFTLEGRSSRWTGRIYGATTTRDLRTSTDIINGSPAAELPQLRRQSLTFWAGGEASRALRPPWRLELQWRTKQRWIADDSLEFQSWGLSQARLGVTAVRQRLLAYAGMAVIDGHLEAESWLAVGPQQFKLVLSSRATSFLDYPHKDRRINLDATPPLPGPIALRRTALSMQLSSKDGQASVSVAQLSTGDHRAATTAGLDLSWAPWKQLLRLHGSLAASSSKDSLIFPTRVHAFAGITLTLPIPRSRARPFVAAYAAFIHNDFSRWLDPRFANPERDANPAGTSLSTHAWISGEIGVKTVDFELRLGIFNATASLLENSRIYEPVRRLNHYSISWRFWPAKK